MLIGRLIVFCAPTSWQQIQSFVRLLTVLGSLLRAHLVGVRGKLFRATGAIIRCILQRGFVPQLLNQPPRHDNNKFGSFSVRPVRTATPGTTPRSPTNSTGEAGGMRTPREEKRKQRAAIRLQASMGSDLGFAFVSP